MILNESLNHSRYIRFLLHFLIGIVIGAAFILIIIGIIVLAIEKKYQNRVYPGLFLFSESISGKTQEELKDFLDQKIDEVEKQKIIFLWKENGEKRWEFTPQEFDFTLDRDSVVREIFLIGRRERGFRKLVAIYDLLTSSKEISPKFNINRQGLKEAITQIAKEVDRAPMDALFEFKDGKVLNFRPSVEGVKLDEESMQSFVITTFSQFPKKDIEVIYDLPAKKINPKISTSEANDLGIIEELAQGESFFKDSIPARVHNIILASSYLHGIVIPPGEIFSFAEKIGTISAATGYKEAAVIKDKRIVMEEGGGVCQVATTLFRAALNAGLPILERQAHYYRVPFYEQGGYPPGLDATVYPPSPDLKFKNDTFKSILIQTEVDRDKKRLVFKFYGTKDGRRVEIDKPKIHSQTPPPEPVYIFDSTLSPGVIKKYDSAHSGAKVSFTRRVFLANGELKEEKTFWSNYTPWPAMYLQGPPAP